MHVKTTQHSGCGHSRHTETLTCLVLIHKIKKHQILFWKQPRGRQRESLFVLIFTCVFWCPICKTLSTFEITPTSYTYPSLVPRPSWLQFLITCSMLKQPKTGARMAWEWDYTQTSNKLQGFIRGPWNPPPLRNLEIEHGYYCGAINISYLILHVTGH